MMTLLKVMGILCCILWAGSGSPLQKGPDPVEEPDGEAKSRPPRQVAYLPFIALPPVYQVHQIILVQPDTRCPEPVPTPGPGVGPAVGPDRDLMDRFGGDQNKTDGPEEPSRCVWSIVACCAPGSRNIRYTCFELLGCPGAFWDVNPCDEKVVMAAANTALRFYEQNSTDTNASRRRK